MSGGGGGFSIRVWTLLVWRITQVSVHKFSEPSVVPWMTSYKLDVAGLANIPGTLLTDSLAAVADILVREQRSVVVVVVVVGTASARMACKRSQEVQRARLP